MRLIYKEFTHPSELCDWVNNNSADITIHSITIDSFGKFILFYSASNSSSKVPNFDADEFYNNFRNKL